jgi:signal transduction histidine kinase
VPAGGEIEFRYVLTVLVLYGLLMALAVVLMTGIAEALRAGERRLRQANAELERLSAMRRAFLHIALHDLKAPVGATAMLLENLASGLGGPLTEKQAHWTNRAQTRLQELLAFIRDLGVLAELETGRVEALAAPVDIGALVRRQVAQHQDLAQQNHHTMQAEVAAGLPRVRGVERLLDEAVANYLTNAIKYTANGGKIVARALARGGAVRIEIADNGKGIAAEDQGRLFNEFVRLGPAGASLHAGKTATTGSPASATAGTGLGLSIVRRIAEAHGGSVGVASQLGKGSTFFIELPAQ